MSWLPWSSKSKYIIFMSILSFVCVATFFLTQTQVLRKKIIFQNKNEIIKQNDFSTFVYTSSGEIASVYEVYVPNLGSRKVGIRADDCLKKIIINGKQIKNIPALGVKGICFHDGIVNVELSDLVKGSRNIVYLVSRNSGGPGGAYFVPATNSFVNVFFYVLIGLLFISLLYPLWIKSFLSKAEAISLSVFTVFCMFYIFTSTSDMRTHDLYGHLEYISYVIRHWKIPPSSECFECFQAPGYYYVSALLTLGVNWLSGSDHVAIFMLRFVSLITMLATLFIVRVIWSRWSGSKTSLILFILTTPAIVFHATRIGNDVFFYLISVLFLLALLKFWDARSIRNLVIVNFVLVIAFLIKATSLALLLCYGVVLVGAYFKGLKKFRTSLLIVFVGALSILSAYYLRNFVLGSPLSFFELNNPGSSLYIKQNLKHFLIVEPVSFFKSAIAQPSSEGSGKEYFWNYFIRSFNADEFGISSTYRSFLIHVRNLAFLLLLVLSFATWIKKSNRHLLWQQFPIFVFFISMLLSLMAFQYRSELSVAANARLVLTFFVGMASLLWMQKKGAKCLLYVSSVCGILFWLSYAYSLNY